ncbi:MAG: PH domain-containing protein [Clostridia bacterium]|nr:PH domain-containing protein [Clostridia bacterium]
MASYVEKNLYENELIVEKARRDKWGLIGAWVLGILFCWLLLIPLIAAIKKTVEFKNTELILTNKRIVRKSGVFRTKAFDAPLSKILNVYVETTFWGKVFNTNKIRITTALGVIVDKIQNADDFKSTVLGQIDQFEEARLARQAAWTAQAMASHVSAQTQTAVAPEKKKRVGRYD